MTLSLRSKGMLLIAVVWILVGLSLLTNGDPPIDSAWHEFILPEARVALWWAAGLGAAGAALDRQEGRRDWLALAVCSIPPMLRLTSYAWSWVMSFVPGDPPGYANGWMPVLLYACMVALVWIVAAIPTGIGATDGDDTRGGGASGSTG